MSSQNHSKCPNCAEFQKIILQKSEQIRAETALRVEAEKRLADIMEILEPLDPPENYAVAVDKIAILATPERYAADPLPTAAKQRLRTKCRHRS